jgi:cytochrome c2
MSGRHDPMTAGRTVRVLLIACAAAGCGASEPAQLVPGGDPARGRELIAVYGCGGCHSVPGVPGASGAVGPPLDGFGDRGFIAGSLRNEPEALMRWIRAPQAVEPGTVMPDLGVGQRQARHIAAYLYTLRSGGLGPPHLLPAEILPRH